MNLNKKKSGITRSIHVKASEEILGEVPEEITGIENSLVEINFFNIVFDDINE